MRKPIKHRREFVSKGSDPTVIVEWTVVDGERELWVQEFQLVYTGYTTGADRRIQVELDPLAAQLVHEGLENEYQQQQEEK